ncbi:MAG: hypothetical protein HFI82_05265 [Eubacterium sp.]|mgnify:CR=1 FL=1|jgi:hypothetical protein|nr:hypothetical protein [Eubacterium sp.]
MQVAHTFAGEDKNAGSAYFCRSKTRMHTTHIFAAACKEDTDENDIIG